jgi:hypothetical protein
MVFLTFLSTLSFSLLDRQPDAYRPRLEKYGPEIASRAARSSQLQESVSQLVKTYEAESATLTAIAESHPDLGKALNDAKTVIDATVSLEAVTPIFTSIGKSFFSPTALPSLSLVSVNTSSYQRIPSLSSVVWEYMNPKTKTREIALNDPQGKFWYFPGSRGIFVFRAPRIHRVSKIVIPDLQRPGCEWQSYRITLLAGKRTTFVRDYKEIKEIALGQIVWFRELKLEINGSRENLEICVPRLELFDDPIPKFQK